MSTPRLDCKKKAAPMRGPPHPHNQARRKLLIPIDGAAEVPTHAELEERHHAVEHELRVAGEQRFLPEDRHPAELNLQTSDSHYCSAAAHRLDLVEESIARESVGAVDENPRITKNGDHVTDTTVRRDPAEVFGEGERADADSTQVIHADGAESSV